MKTARTTITLPRPRFDQLVAIASHRGLPNPGALIEQWIAAAIAAGEIPPELPGLSCQRSGADFIVSVRDKVLPPIPAHKARVLASVLTAAAGESDPEIDFVMTPGKPVSIDIGEDHLVVARAGQAGVRVIVKPKNGGDSMLATLSPSFAIALADQIRAEFP